MKLWVIVLILLLVPVATALSAPVTQNGKTYYKVTSTDATEDTGAEVCAKAGLSCVGYTDKTTAVCKQYNPTAATTSSLSGDAAGVYCNGAPQNGECSTKTNTCHTCPACTNTVTCNQAIGGLYREMYVECGTGACAISLGAKTTDQFLAQLSGISAQLAACPQPLPPNVNRLIKDGDTTVNIYRTAGGVSTFRAVIKNSQLIGLKSGPGKCVQAARVNEVDFDSVLVSSDPGSAVAFIIGQKKAKIKGCTILSKAKFFFAKPIIKSIAKKQAPAAPAPKPAPNCGNVGEQCDNRACYSGICGAPKEQNSNGQWGHWKYTCLDQKDWNTYCQGFGNTPPAWRCLTSAGC